MNRVGGTTAANAVPQNEEDKFALNFEVDAITGMPSCLRVSRTFLRIFIIRIHLRSHPTARFVTHCTRSAARHLVILATLSRSPDRILPSLDDYLAQCQAHILSGSKHYSVRGLVHTAQSRCRPLHWHGRWHQASGCDLTLYRSMIMISSQGPLRCIDSDLAHARCSRAQG